MQKTYKREVAISMLMFVVGAHTAGMWFSEAVQMAEYLTTPVFMFAGAAFGMDAYAKQVN